MKDLRTFFLSALALLVLLLSSTALAQSCEPGDPAGFCTLIPPGATSDDVSPYCFIPTLLRGQRDQHYAYTSFSEEGTCHSFQVFMKFELPPNLLQPGEVIQQAFLDVPYLYTFVFSGDPLDPPHPPVSLSAHRVSEPWSENSVSWSTKPDFDVAPLGTVTGITGYGAQTFDVTAQVQSWAQSPASNYGFALTSTDSQVLGFYSWESAVSQDFKPALVIVFGPGTPPPICGDVDEDTDVDWNDVDALRLALADPVGSSLKTGGEDRCSVVGSSMSCDLLDVVILQRALVIPSLGPGIQPVCMAMQGS